MRKNYRTHEELGVQLDKSSEFRKEYRAAKPYYDLVIQVIKRRIKLRMTQKDLAKKAKTFQSRISKIESGEYDLRLSTLIQIAEALDTEVKIVLEPIKEISYSPGRASKYINFFESMPNIQPAQDFSEGEPNSIPIKDPIFAISE